MVTIGISLIGYFFYLNIKSNQELDAERINISGRQRILSQKVVKSIFIIGDKRERHKVDAYCTELSIPLAEDNAINQKLATLTMKNLDYQIDVVGSGIEAVESVKRQRYDIVFMDVQMPEMDGVEATKIIIKDFGPDRPVIVAMTANAMEGDREKFLKEGMDDYLSMPIDFDEIQTVLTNSANKKYFIGS